MASVKWRGDAKGVTQIDVQQITGTPAVGSSFTATCNGKTISFTILSTTPVVTTLLQALIDGFISAWNANATAQNGVAEFSEASCTQFATDKLQFAGLVPGDTFSFTYAGAGGVTAVTDGTNSVAGTGPKDAANVANYSTGALPSAGDDLWFDDASNGPEFGLTALSAIGLGNIYITPNFKGRIGRAPRVVAGRSTYIEYRQQYLKLKSNSSSSALNINATNGLLRFDLQTFQWNIHLQNTGSGTGQGFNQQSGQVPPLTVIGTNASNACVIDKGSIGGAYYPGELLTLLTLRMGYVDSVDSDAKFQGGTGLTLTTLSKTGGEAILQAGLTTLIQQGGETTLNNGNLTTATIYGGTFNYAGTGTIGTISCYPGATCTFTQSNQARTCTNTTMYPGSVWQDPSGTVTHTNPISVPGGSPTQVSGTTGSGRAVAVQFI